MVENLKELGMLEWQAYRNENTRKDYLTVAESSITVTMKDLHTEDITTYPKRTSQCT